MRGRGGGWGREGGDFTFAILTFFAAKRQFAAAAREFAKFDISRY